MNEVVALRSSARPGSLHRGRLATESDGFRSSPPRARGGIAPVTACIQFDERLPFPSFMHGAGLVQGRRMSAVESRFIQARMTDDYPPMERDFRLEKNDPCPPWKGRHRPVIERILTSARQRNRHYRERSKRAPEMPICILKVTDAPPYSVAGVQRGTCCSGQTAYTYVHNTISFDTPPLTSVEAQWRMQTDTQLSSSCSPSRGTWSVTASSPHRPHQDATAGSSLPAG